MQAVLAPALCSQQCVPHRVHTRQEAFRSLKQHWLAVRTHEAKRQRLQSERYRGRLAALLPAVDPATLPPPVTRQEAAAAAAAAADAEQPAGGVGGGESGGGASGGGASDQQQQEPAAAGGGQQEGVAA